MFLHCLQSNSDFKNDHQPTKQTTLVYYIDRFLLKKIVAMVYLFLFDRVLEANKKVAKLYFKGRARPLYLLCFLISVMSWLHTKYLARTCPFLNKQRLT
jgi:hypothetical protein